MMGKTHVSMGIAAAFLVLQPTTAGEFAVAVIGGAGGGLLPDIEVRSSLSFRDPMNARWIALALALLFLGVDEAVDGPILTAVAQNSPLQLFAGALIFLVAGLFGRRSAHRTFTHSLLGLAVFCFGLGLVCAPLVVSFAVGFASHVLLDLLNKKPVQLFYPLKAGRFCLKLVYANGVVNVVCLVVGVVFIAAWTGWALIA